MPFTFNCDFNCQFVIVWQFVELKFKFTCEIYRQIVFVVVSEKILLNVRKLRKKLTNYGTLMESLWKMVLYVRKNFRFAKKKLISVWNLVGNCDTTPLSLCSSLRPQNRYQKIFLIVHSFNSLSCSFFLFFNFSRLNKNLSGHKKILPPILLLPRHRESPVSILCYGPDCVHTGAKLVWKRHFRRNNLRTDAKRSKMKLECLAASCEHKLRSFFVPLANQASQVSKQ
jgi:hypothetical protein